MKKNDTKNYSVYVDDVLYKIKRSSAGLYHILTDDAGVDGNSIYVRTTAKKLCEMGIYDQLGIEKRGLSVNLENDV